MEVMEKSKVKPYSISEFVNTGLLRFVNIFLHIFGLALCYSVSDDGKIEEEKGLQVIRVKCRGFSEAGMMASYIQLSKYMDTWHKELLEESKM